MKINIHAKFRPGRAVRTRYWRGHTLKKIIQVMKIAMLLITVATLHVSAAAYSQQVSLRVKRAPLQEVMQQIRQQTGYAFAFDSESLKTAKLVSITLINTPIEETLQQLFKDQPFTYQIKGKSIFITEKTFLDRVAEKFSREPAAAAQQLFSGRVSSAGSGEPVKGATIRIKGTKVLTFTDDNGHFQLPSLTNNDVLVITSVGFEPMEAAVSQLYSLAPGVTVNNDHGIFGKLSSGGYTFAMNPALTDLDQVRIIGYGTTTERLNTGNVAVVTSEDIAKQPVSNVLQALQNRVPGLAVSQTSGYASAPFNVKIRGQNNMAPSPNIGVNDNSEPLYIIDGVPIVSSVGPSQRNLGINQNSFEGPTAGQSPLFGINPSDIQSISILKDADATAIYGARGANGVILITTKKGEPGKTTLDANVYTGLSLQTKKLRLMNTQEYLAMRRRAFSNDQVPMEDWNAYDLTMWDTLRYTDWQKEFLSSAHTTDAQLSLSGGNANTSFRLSGGFNTQTPPYQGDFREQRASGSLNLTNHSFNNRLTTSAIVNFSSTSSNLPASDPISLIFLAPNAPALFDEDGGLNFAEWKTTAGYLPYNVPDLIRPYNASTKNLVSNLTVSYELLPGLDIRSSFGYTITRQNQIETSPSGSFDPSYTPGRETRFGINNLETWLIEPTINWNKNYGVHHLQALLGSTFQNAEVDGSDITARGFTNDATMEDMGAAGSLEGYNNYIKTRFASIYARLNYDYKQKYILTLNGRRDASSKFASGRQFGNFGSVGAAWIFSGERFIADHIHFLSFGKLRASYGLVGGDGLGDYQYLSSFKNGTDPYQGSPALVLSRLANDQFSWTSSKKAEIGLDLGFLNGRIQANLSTYRNRSGNQLVGYPLPATAGFSSITANLAAVVQNSGWELSLQSQNITSPDFEWSSNFNISGNRNKLIAFPDLEISSYRNRYAIGRSISSTGMLHYTGVDPATGLYTFADINGNGQFDSFGSTDYIYKDNTPTFFGGLNNNIRYKDFQFGFFLAFTKQRGFLRLSNQNPGSISGGVGNQLILSEQLSGKPVEEALTTNTYVPDLANYMNSDAVLVDASYIRLQNLSFSYNFASRLLGKIHLQNLRLYIQGQNMLTFTGYKGSDPAMPGSFSLPPRKIITTGLQMTL